jgi:large subunit ribosomal protein L13
MWHLVDAKDQLVGRIATQIAPILRGKHKPTFSPNYDCGDYVVIINAQHCKFTGSKDKQKTYSWHTGYPGGVKHTNPATLREDNKPEEVSVWSYYDVLVRQVNLI